MAAVILAVVAVVVATGLSATGSAPRTQAAVMPGAVPNAAGITAQAASDRAHRLPGGRFQIRHVFVIVLENESEPTSFGPSSPARYLARTLVSKGAYLPNYYGTGHYSNDNYIAMVSGQAPNPSNQSDCPTFSNFQPRPLGRYGQEPGAGCVYPANVQTIASQLDRAGLSWRDYEESMGADRSRESSRCGHPRIGASDNTETATPSDLYATRHNPFVYFHSIIDNRARCDSHVVNLNLLPRDLAHVATTPNYSFIVPDLCDDGHDAPCPGAGPLSGPGGLTQVNAFLSRWVPKITASKAFRQDGLLIITFDEAVNDSSSCCHEIPGLSGSHPGDGESGSNSGGGRVGAVLLSPCIAPRTVSKRPYNHYTMLGSIENIFGLSHLGYAGLPGEHYFGTDIFNRRCGPGRVRHDT